MGGCQEHVGVVARMSLFASRLRGVVCGGGFGRGAGDGGAGESGGADAVAGFAVDQDRTSGKASATIRRRDA